MEKAWVLSIRDQCHAAQVPFFFKQWGGVRKADYTKPKNGRPGYVVMTMTDGTRNRYTVPTSEQVTQADATAQPGSPLGSSTLER